MEWTVPGVGDCTIKVTESAYDEAKKKGKYQRLHFDLYGSEYMSSGWLLPVLLVWLVEVLLYLMYVITLLN